MSEDLYDEVQERIYSCIDTGKDIKDILTFVLEPLIERIDDLECKVDSYGY